MMSDQRPAGPKAPFQRKVCEVGYRAGAAEREATDVHERRPHEVQAGQS